MMWQLLGLFSFRSVFVESFCRTQTLSLAGRLLYPVVDTFVVQWPGLVRRCVPRLGAFAATAEAPCAFQLAAGAVHGCASVSIGRGTRSKWL